MVQYILVAYFIHKFVPPNLLPLLPLAPPPFLSPLVTTGLFSVSVYLLLFLLYSLPYDTEIPLLGIYLKKKTSNLKRYTHPSVPSSFS